MKRRQRMMTYGGLGLAAAAAAGAALTYRRYRQDAGAAYERLAALERHTLETPCGPVEYALRGTGEPVLVIHGSGGGFDQSLGLGTDHLGPGYRIIAPSRFGYLGTPMPDGGDVTPATQADALACLLDQLDVERAAVVAYSAGGVPAVQLALRHPERVATLVLVSTAVADRAMELPPRSVMARAARSDFLFWLLTHPLEHLTRRAFVPSDVDLNGVAAAKVAAELYALLPMQPRAEGLLFDMYVTNTDPHQRPDAYPLEEVAVPTLIINAVDDPLADYEDARAMSRRLPHARLLTIRQGGHLMAGNDDLVRAEIQRFLTEYGPV